MASTSQTKPARSRSFRPMHRMKKAFSQAAAIIPTHRYESDPFVFVVGLHSSGSSAMAGVLYHLGVHMGNKLGGYYGNKPDRSCGYEDQNLADFCDEAVPSRSVEMNCSLLEAKQFLNKWIIRRRREAWWLGTIAGCKYPKLGPMADVVREIVGPELRVIDINRPLNESIASLVRRDAHTDPKLLAAHQTWLWNGKLRFLASLPPETIMQVEYAHLLKQPEQVISNVVEFLKLVPSLKQVTKAVAYVDPDRRHVFEAGNSGVIQRKKVA
jgi:hypothetical protein